MPACCNSQDCCSQYPWPRGRPLLTLISARDSQTLIGKSGSVSCHCSSLPGHGTHKVSLYPPKVCFPGRSQFFCQTPTLGNLLWALELLQQWEIFFAIIALQFMRRLFGSSMGALTVTSSKRAYATLCDSQVCCSQSPCRQGRSLLTQLPQDLGASLTKVKG